MRIRACCDWADCWRVGDIFEVHENESGFAYIMCRDVENGPQHNIDNGGEEDLTILDIQNGKSQHFEPLP